MSRRGPVAGPGGAPLARPQAPVPAPGGGTRAALVTPDAWDALRRFTPARIALGRAGDSLPTAALLELGVAQALARDAVREASQQRALLEALHKLGLDAIGVHSSARDREEYLRRPDRGRRLDAVSRTRLQTYREQAPPGICDIAIVLADGLSPAAALRHGLPLVQQLRAPLASLRVGPVVVADMARVALGDEIGALLQADLVAVCIGERPGLTAPDSLGVYLTRGPRIGRRDSERNCLSNIRPEGLDYASAARRLVGLIEGARRLGQTGVALKDESGSIAAEIGSSPPAAPGGATPK
jgi:ethanolamine ammonia-lyase small subunit